MTATQLPLVIGIAGPRRHGKDALGRHFVERHGYERRAFADAVREAALILDPIIDDDRRWPDDPPLYRRLSDIVEAYGWDTAKEDYPEVRRTLILVGIKLGRDFFSKTTWLDRVLPAPHRVVITDVRFENEVEAVYGSRGVVVRVIRPGHPISEDESEHAIDHLNLPVVVNHGSLADLHLAGEDVVREQQRQRSRASIGCPRCGSYRHTEHECPLLV